MNSFYNLIASLIKESEESTHSSFKVVDPTHIGDNPVKELSLDVVPLNDGNSIVSLAWKDSAGKVLEKTTSSDEANHMAQLISSDLAQVAKLTGEDKYDEAKGIMQNVLKTYAETSDTPIETNVPVVTTTQAAKDEMTLLKRAKITMQNLWFSNPDELLEFQTKMKELQPKTDQDSIPLWDMNKAKPEEKTPELAAPSVSYDQLEKEKAQSEKNITKRIETEVKEQIESSLEQKQATLFTDKDKQLVEALRGVGRSWEEVRDFMTKSLKYEKEDVAAYLDQFRGNEQGEEINVVKEKSLPTMPKPPKELVPDEVHEKLLKDLDKEPTEEKKIEPLVKEVKEPKFTPKDIMEIPEEEEVEEKESALNEISRADNSEIRRVASQDKTALNPLQEPIKVEPTQETPTQDTVPMGMGVDHPTPKPEDWVIVKSDLNDELSSFRAKFVSEETHGDGSKWGIVDRDGELLTVEMHRVSKESEGAQTTEPVSAPTLAQPEEPEIAVTPKMEDLHSASLKEAAKDDACYACGKPSTHSFQGGNDPRTGKWCDKCFEKQTKKHEKYEKSEKESSLEDIKAKIVKCICGHGTLDHKDMKGKCESCKCPGWELDKNPEVRTIKQADETSDELRFERAVNMLDKKLMRGNIHQEEYDAAYEALKKQMFPNEAPYKDLLAIKAEVKKLEAQLKTAEEEKDVCSKCGKEVGLIEMSKWVRDGLCSECRGTEKQAADPVPAETPKTEYKEVKISPKFVDKEKAVPVTPNMEQILVKMESLQSKLSVLDQAKEKIKATTLAELQKIDVGGERSALEKELQDSYDKLGILIDATESKIVQWSENLYTMQHEEKEIVPKPSTKELLEKIYQRFAGAEEYVERVLNGFKSLAKKVQTQTLVKWPKRSSLEPVQKEASVMDDLNQLNEDMLKALQALS
jgi:hypothetical protein